FISDSGGEFRGIHYYDGQLGQLELSERELVAHQGYDRLMELLTALSDSALAAGEVITAGTPAFPCTLTYSGFKGGSFAHRASRGPVSYGNSPSFTQLPGSWNSRPAALVISTVVSHPSDRRITCDAGHKTVSADAGTPTSAILGRAGLLPAKPS